MATTCKFVSLIVCDDCRREDTGKDIIIGAYTGAMIVPVLPALLSSFALRFEIIPYKNHYQKVVTTMVGPRGEEVLRGDGSFGVPRPQFGASLFYKIAPLTITEAGEYKIFLGLDEEPEQVGTLRILNEPAPVWVQPPSVA